MNCDPMWMALWNFRGFDVVLKFRWFGAKGDSIHDDGPAWRRAMWAGRILLWLRPLVRSVTIFLAAGDYNLMSLQRPEHLENVVIRGVRGGVENPR